MRFRLQRDGREVMTLRGDAEHCGWWWWFISQREGNDCYLRSLKWLCGFGFFKKRHENGINLFLFPHSVGPSQHVTVHTTRAS